MTHVGFKHRTEDETQYERRCRKTKQVQDIAQDPESEHDPDVNDAGIDAIDTG